MWRKEIQSLFIDARFTKCMLISGYEIYRVGCKCSVLYHRPLTFALDLFCTSHKIVHWSLLPLVIRILITLCLFICYVLAFSSNKFSRHSAACEQSCSCMRLFSLSPRYKDSWKYVPFILCGSTRTNFIAFTVESRGA